MFGKMFVMSLSVLLLLGNAAEQKLKNSIISIKELDGRLDFYNWHYSDDQKLIGRVKTVVKEIDKSGVMKASIDDFGIQFFLFENEIGTPVEFNANINLLVQDVSMYPGIKSVKDYIDVSINEMPIILNNVNLIDKKIRNIGGYECGIIEATYEQNIGYKTFSLYMISMSILKDKRAFVFTGTTLRNMAEAKKPLLEKILFSLKQNSTGK